MSTLCELAYMFDATQDYGLGWGVGNDVNVP